MPLSAITRIDFTEFHGSQSHVYPWDASPLDGNVTTRIFDIRDMCTLAVYSRTYMMGSRENGSPVPNHDVFILFREICIVSYIVQEILVELQQLSGPPGTCKAINYQRTVYLSETVANIFAKHPEWKELCEYENAEAFFTPEENGYWKVAYKMPYPG